MPLDQDLDLSVLPLDEAGKLLGRDAARLDILAGDLERAQATYEVRVTAAPHADVPEVRQRLDAEHLPGIEGAEREVASSARAIADRARAVIQLSGAAPAELTAGQRVEAGGLAPFAEADCRDLPLGKLADVVRAVIVASDTAAMFAYGQFLPKRLAQTASEVGRRVDETDARERSELSRLLRVIAERLQDPDFAPVKTKALEVLGRAEKIARDAEKRSVAAYLATKPFIFQGKNDVDWGPR